MRYQRAGGGTILSTTYQCGPDNSRSTKSLEGETKKDPDSGRYGSFITLLWNSLNEDKQGISVCTVQLISLREPGKQEL